ncbi:hypothetical protein EVAR_30017_1 [Eumeta japonica]|uniref:Death domain-containing protein n=1 Tax=Eumeta variegata TaxID=151549 RepID=A0A4C1VWS5_EUMVA|nr:hypothetical protein EVAR_30017_1 [Eumeta japonica]
MNIPEFEYIADHLTEEECRHLVAALHFVSYDLPASLSAAERKVPLDVPCINLLLQWNSGKEKWEGYGKGHEEVAHRLRQLGKRDLADWLGKTVFDDLAKDVNDTLLNSPLGKTEKKNANQHLYVDREPPSEEEEWTALDSILWVALFSCICLTLLVFVNIIRISRKRASLRKAARKDEMKNLIRNDGGTDTEEEIYNVEKSSSRNKKQRHSDLVQLSTIIESCPSTAN